MVCGVFNTSAHLHLYFEINNNIGIIDVSLFHCINCIYVLKVQLVDQHCRLFLFLLSFFRQKSIIYFLQEAIWSVYKDLWEKMKEKSFLLIFQLYYFYVIRSILSADNGRKCQFSIKYFFPLEDLKRSSRLFKINASITIAYWKYFKLWMNIIWLKNTSNWKN